MAEQSRFPISVFPTDIQEIIGDLHDKMGYPVEYTASSMLVALATAMGNNWRLHVRTGWEERALLYLAIVGNAGANKTHPMRFALSPLVDIDLAKIESAEGIEPYVAPPRLVASDVTQEGLIKLHQKNPRGMVLFVDELKAWVNNFSRYSGGSQEQFWLSNFSRTPIIVDRKGDARPISVAEPLISVIGSTQPSVLSSFASGDKSTNGFVDRMLWVIKDRADKQPWSEAEADSGFGEAWSYVISLLATREEVINVRFSPEAREQALAWQTMNVEMINSCLNDRMVGVYSKMEIHFVRFCLILHALYCQCYEEYDDEVICSEIVEKARLLAEYFRGEAERAQEWLYPDPKEVMSERERAFYNALPDYFTRKDGVKVGLSIGLSKTAAYGYIKAFTDVKIGVAEDGSFYKFEAGLDG